MRSSTQQIALLVLRLPGLWIRIRDDCIKVLKRLTQSAFRLLEVFIHWLRSITRVLLNKTITTIK